MINQPEASPLELSSLSPVMRSPRASLARHSPAVAVVALAPVEVGGAVASHMADVATGVALPSVPVFCDWPWLLLH